MAGLIVKVGGEGGTDSPTTAGEFIALSAIREGNHIFTLRTLPAEIKGGLATYQVRCDTVPVASQGDGPDVLFCMNQEAYDKLFDELSPAGGVLVYDSDAVHLDRMPDDQRIYYGIPMGAIAEGELKERRTKNMVLLGAFSQLFGLPLETLKQCVQDKYGKRGEALVAMNHAALEAGYRYALEHLAKSDPYQFVPTARDAGQQRLIIDGSEAVAIGAAVSQLQIYAGYPITPASDIMHWLAQNLPRFGGTVIQTEDEMAALATCLGASFAGARTMTATSGPGLSLMVELLGLASMAELPVVVVDAQRGGPSTGLPTKCEDGDLNLAVLGAHGDAPRIVVAPANIHDCLYDTIGAFNLAEKYQTPVILLTDQSMAMRTQAVDPPDLAAIQLEQRRLAPRDEQVASRSGYRRYALTDDNISPMAVPGVHAGHLHTITGLSHDEWGNPATNDGAMSAAMMDKRHRKIQAARLEAGWSRTHGPDTAEVGIISWGSIEGSVHEAIGRLAEEGVVARQLHLRMLYPLPVEELTAFAATVERLFVCELNFSGQLTRMIRGETDLRPRLIHKYDGVPFTPADVLAAVHEEL